MTAWHWLTCCLAIVYLVPVASGWALLRRCPLPAASRHRRASGAACALTDVRLTPDVDEDGINEEIGIRIGPSPGKGYGAFALRHFEAGSIVGDYCGEAISRRDIGARYDKTESLRIDDHLWVISRQKRGIPTTGDYLYRVEDDLYIDAEDPDVSSSWARFINHASQPNLQGKSLAKSYTGEPRVWFVARCDIEPGDELTWDYGDDYWTDEDTVV